MTGSLRIYLALLAAVVFGWLWFSGPAVVNYAGTNWEDVIGITAIYLCSHLLRILRLVLLTLDKRGETVPLISAHAMTAFPSSFLPFKLGEVLRLAAFFRACDSHQKAIAVWLAERFGDIIVIVILIFGLYMYGSNVPSDMRAVFIAFSLLSSLGLFGLFAIAKAFVYLNRNLVLTSLSPRGLLLLRTSHVLRSIETNIHRSIEGRVSGFILVTVMIWLFETLALSLFIELLASGESDFSKLFASSLLASLMSGSQNTFGIYQSLALFALTVTFLVVVWLAAHFKIKRI
jgi:hypothetical protein